MRAFLFEHVCGGGMVAGPLPDELAAQGLAMLVCLAEDFVRLGIDVTVTIDPRVPLDLEGVTVEPVQDEARLEETVRQCAADADCTLIIAPEFERLLPRWCRVVTPVANTLLNAEVDTIEACSDKLKLSQIWINAEVPTPHTDVFSDAHQWAGPVIVKPRRGAGCERTYLCSTEYGLSRLPQLTDHLIQPYIPGLAASVLCIVHENGHIQPLRAGRQFIDIASGEEPRIMTYQGGEVPLLPEALEARAVALATRAIEAVPGLLGFAGVDLVLGETAADDYAIELNPRVTMSYVGLRQLCKGNLLEPLLHPDAGVRCDWRDATVRFDAAGTVMRSRSG